MSKRTVTIHVYAKIGQYDKPGSLAVFDCDMRGNDTCMRSLAWLCSQEVELDIPEHDITEIQIDALEAQVKAERAESQSRVNLLLERISKLRAIGHEVAQ